LPAARACSSRGLAALILDLVEEPIQKDRLRRNIEEDRLLAF